MWPFVNTHQQCSTSLQTVHHLQLHTPVNRRLAVQLPCLMTDSSALQAKLAEHIRQKNVAENMQLAWDHSPEVFGRVIMLYVDMEVGAW